MIAIDWIIDRLGKIPWLLLGITSVGALLRLAALGKDGLWFDEIITALFIKLPFIDIIRYAGQPPLYYLLLHLWTVVFGTSDVALQSLSAIIGIICIPLMYAVGSAMFGKKTGLLAAFLLAISGLAIGYSLEVRMYSLLLFLTLLSFLFFVRILTAERTRKTDVLCYSISNVLLGLTQLYGFFTIGTQILYFILFRHRYGKARAAFWTAQAITLIPFGVAIPLFIRLGRYVYRGSIAGDVPVFTIQQVTLQLRAFCGGSIPGVIMVLALCLMAILGFSTTKSRSNPRESGPPAEKIQLKTLLFRPKTALLLFWLLLPMIASLFISGVWEPIFRIKYLIGGLPALYLLAARGILNTTPLFNRYVKRLDITYILPATVALVLLAALLPFYSVPQREQWREASAFVQQASQPGDVIVVCPDTYRFCFDYYYKGNSPEFGISLGADGEKLTELVDQASAAKDRLWLVLLTYPSTKDAPVLPYLLARYGTDPSQSKVYLWITVYLFDLQTRPP